MKSPKLNCRACGWWMGRSHVKGGQVRCGKCKTVHDVVIGAANSASKGKCK